MPEPCDITPDTLLTLIGTPTCPVLVDVCTDPDFAEDPVLIPGAQRWPHTDLGGIADMTAGRTAVIVCQKGLKLSQGVAAWLRSAGQDAQVLRGGMVAWRQTEGAPVIAAGALPDRLEGATRWVAPVDDRIATDACKWLVHRFIDRDARILSVSPDAVPGVVQHFAATELICDPDDPFTALCQKVSLRSQALGCLATVIHAADTGRWDQSPQAAGLAAVWVGLPRGDAGRMAILDALNGWALGTGGRNQMQPMDRVDDHV